MIGDVKQSPLRRRLKIKDPADRTGRVSIIDLVVLVMNQVLESTVDRMALIRSSFRSATDKRAANCLQF